MICIDHMLGVIRRENVLKHISTRFSKMYPIQQYALPTYTIVDTPNKKYDILCKNDKINVVCIGYNNMPRSSEELRSIFYNFDDIIFHIINHQIMYIYDDCTNILTYQNCEVNKMFDILINADYVLALQNNNTKDFTNGCMSSQIPISFSVLCQLILPNSWKNSYNFKSSMGYDKIGGTQIHLQKASFPIIEQVFNERTALIQHRNKVFSEIILEH